jgi:Domain of unknown function (DUF4258)
VHRVSFTISKHAEKEMLRRQISREWVESLMEHPDQIVEAHGGLLCYQCLSTNDGKPYLLRAVINGSVDPKKIVTIYRTTKVKKYWKI